MFRSLKRFNSACNVQKAVPRAIAKPICIVKLRQMLHQPKGFLTLAPSLASFLAQVRQFLCKFAQLLVPCERTCIKLWILTARANHNCYSNDCLPQLQTKRVIQAGCLDNDQNISVDESSRKLLMKRKGDGRYRGLNNAVTRSTTCEACARSQQQLELNRLMGIAKQAETQRCGVAVCQSKRQSQSSNKDFPQRHIPLLKNNDILFSAQFSACKRQNSKKRFLCLSKLK